MGCSGSLLQNSTDGTRPRIVVVGGLKVIAGSTSLRWSHRPGLRVVNRLLWVAIEIGLGARRSKVESLDLADISLDASVLANHGTNAQGQRPRDADPRRAAHRAA